MIKKILKFNELIKFRIKYPMVRQIGIPRYLSFLGFSRVQSPMGFYSQAGQDAYLFTEFYHCLQLVDSPKLFIDIGCNHPTVHSNSFFFESNQGYKVIAIDALTEISNLWSRTRPNAEFIECAVGNKTEKVEFEVVEGGDNESMFSSVCGYSSKTKSKETVKRIVTVRRLDDILSSLGINQAGIVSIDIEGYELQALEGLDFNMFSASVFIIENNGRNGLGDDRIRSKMRDNGYIYYARIWNLDDIFVRPEAIRKNTVKTVENNRR
jgi:FkbM family methyltransferase